MATAPVPAPLSGSPPRGHPCPPEGEFNPLSALRFLEPYCGKVKSGCRARLSSYAVIICSMNETPRIPSPIPYLMQVPDLAHAVHAGADELGQRTHQRAGHRPVDMRISGTGCWPWGLAEEKPLRPCPIYRFMWALEQQAVVLQLWAGDVLQALGQHQEAGLLEVSLDGQHLEGSARGGVGDKAIVLVLAYLSRLGLSLLQSKAAGDEAAAGRGLMMEVGADLAEARMPWTRPRRPRSSCKRGAPLPPSQGQSGRAEGLGSAPAAVPAGR